MGNNRRKIRNIERTMVRPVDNEMLDLEQVAQQGPQGPLNEDGLKHFLEKLKRE